MIACAPSRSLKSLPPRRFEGRVQPSGPKDPTHELFVALRVAPSCPGGRERARTRVLWLMSFISRGLLSELKLSLGNE